MICRRCKQDKPETAFKVQRRNLSGRDGTCRECVRERRRETLNGRSKRPRSTPLPTPEQIRQRRRAFDQERFESLPGRQTAGDAPINRDDSRDVVRRMGECSGQAWTPADEEALYPTIDLYDEPEPTLDVDGQECKR
jgi:hypothetical protein